MATYSGIMAGIGDLETGTNVISPQFDAKVNDFIIGQNGILTGLEIDTSSKTITAGVCIAKGYRGAIESNIDLDTTSYVYGVFKVYHDSNTLDEFYIETSSKALTEGGDDILHTAGTYRLRLNTANRISYPLNAVNSDYTDQIVVGGIIAGTADGAEKNNVTAVTQPVDTSNATVATTEFVQKQVAADINYQSFSKTFTVTESANSRSIQVDTTVTASKKAGYCLIDITFAISTGKLGGGTMSRSTVLGTLDEEFFPASLVRCIGYNSSYDLSEPRIFNITTEGKIKIDDTYGYALSVLTTSYSLYTLNVGYEAANI